MDEWLNRQITVLVPLGIVSSNLTSFSINSRKSITNSLTGWQ